MTAKRGCCTNLKFSCNSPAFVPLPTLTRSPFPAITGKASGSNGIASPVYGGGGRRSEPMGACNTPFFFYRALLCYVFTVLDIGI